jgi:hypothetical protein
MVRMVADPLSGTHAVAHDRKSPSHQDDTASASPKITWFTKLLRNSISSGGPEVPKVPKPIEGNIQNQGSRVVSMPNPRASANPVAGAGLSLELVSSAQKIRVSVMPMR